MASPTKCREETDALSGRGFVMWNLVSLRGRWNGQLSHRDALEPESKEEVQEVEPIDISVHPYQASILAAK